VLYKRKSNKVRRTAIKRSLKDATAPNVQPEVTATTAQHEGKKKDAPMKKASNPDSSAPPKKKKKSPEPEKVAINQAPQMAPTNVSTNQLAQVSITARLEPLQNFEQCIFSQPPPPVTHSGPIRSFDFGTGKHIYVPQTGLTYREVAQTPRGGGRGSSYKSRGSPRNYQRQSQAPVYYEVTNSIPFVPGGQ